MTTPVIIGTPAGTRRIEAAELPVRIGTGTRADIRLPGPVTDNIVGLISVLDGRPLLQKSADQPALSVNGEMVAATRWLADGDVIVVESVRIECHFDAAAFRLSVAYTDVEYATLPPVAEEPQGERITAVPKRPAAPGPAADRRLWPWAVYVALAVLAGLAWQLFTARAVRLDVQPPEAELDIGGTWLALRLGGRFLLRPGSYTVQASAEGFEPLSSEITVGDAPSQDFRFELRKLPGQVVIAPQPAVPVRIFVDGQEVTAGPDGALRIAAGSHALRVVASRYQPYENAVEVEGRNRLQTITVALVPDWADVTISSRPEGAQIVADGEPLGTTPATVALLAGVRQLELRKEGFRTWRQTLTATAGERLDLPLVELREADGVLTVTSAPAGAAVTVDGRYRGTTPLEVEIAPGRAHRVILAKPGYETVTRSVAMEKRGGQTVNVELQARTGLVRVRSEPSDAELYVDGERRGEANQELTLSAVPHRLEVRKTGFAPFVTEVTPTPGLPQALEVKLLTPEQAVLAATPRTVRSSQGLVLRLIEPGRFEMGAPRREQGRRPNETQRQVKLTRRYYIAAREVTNREFREFKPNHTSGAEKYQELAGGEHPVVMLSWEEAVAYCNWLSDRESLPQAYALKEGVLRLAEPLTTGYRLPTEAEWEWATRYNGGGGVRRYPWGNQMPPAAGSGNFADESAKGVVPNVVTGYDDGYPVTAPVAKFAASPLGLYDVGGNVAEWVHDIYSVYSGSSAGEAVDPVGPESGQYRAIRGSSWRHASISELRFAYRDFGDQGRLDVGFRIARYAE